AEAIGASRLMARDVLVRPVVHERYREQTLGASAGGEMGGGRRHDVATPRVLDRDLNSELIADIPQQSRLGQSTHSRYLQIDRARATLTNRTQESRQVRHDLVVYHRQRRALPDLDALLHRGARLFQIEPRQRLHGAGGEQGIIESPAAVGICNDEILWPGRLDDLAHTE